MSSVSDPTPGSRCALEVRRESGLTIEAGSRVAGADGLAAFGYAPLGVRGESVQTATCSLGDRATTAGAKVVLP